MALFDTKKERAALVLGLLAVGLAVAMGPYVSGLLGAPVLYVLFAPIHRFLSRKLPRSLAAGLVILIAFLLIVLPGAWLIGMLVGQAQGVAASLVDSPLLARLQTLRVGQFEVGPQLAAIGKDLITFLGGSALGFIGTATRFTLNLLFSFFGLYYLLINPEGAWRAVAPYIPFSRENVAILRERFVSITGATVVGTGLVALIQ
jgi:predicted PurR-regulated permease PerM